MPRSLLESGFSTVRKRGLRYAAVAAVREGLSKVFRETGQFQGKTAFESDWDLLIVLDACRADALEEIANEFEFLGPGKGWTYSVASCSSTWMRRTFTQDYADEMGKTIYITANPFSEELVPTASFQHVEEVWKSAYDPNIGTIPPRNVTDHAIEAARKYNPDKVIVHYMQPHFPSIPSPLGFGIRMCADDPNEQEWVWHGGKPLEYTRQELWKARSEERRVGKECRSRWSPYH